MHWVWVLEREDVKPVLVPQVAAHPLNTKVVCHLCKDDDDYSYIFFSFYFLSRSFLEEAFYTKINSGKQFTKTIRFFQYCWMCINVKI